MKLIVVFAGPNGSGKSSIIGKLKQQSKGLFEFPDIEINLDDIASILRLQARLFSSTTCTYSRVQSHSAEVLAAEYAGELRELLLSKGEDFILETVLSMGDRLSFLHRAKAIGYTIKLVYVTTNNPEINVQRVRQRVANGGHNIPIEKIYQRYTLSMNILHKAINIADKAIIIDNSAPEGPNSIEIVLTKEKGIIKLYTPKPGRAKWVNEKIAAKFQQTGVIFEDVPRAFAEN